MHRKEPWEWALIAAFTAALAAMIGLALYAVMKDQWDFEAEVTIAVEPAILFDSIASAKGRSSWQFGVLDVAPLTGDGDAVGDTALVYMRTEGRSWQIDERLVAYDPPRLWQALRSEPGMLSSLRIEIMPSGAGGARVIWRESLRYQGPFSRLIAPFTLFEREEQADASLRRLADIATRP